MNLYHRVLVVFRLGVLRRSLSGLLFGLRGTTSLLKRMYRGRRRSSGASLISCVMRRTNSVPYLRQLVRGGSSVNVSNQDISLDDLPI